MWLSLNKAEDSLKELEEYEGRLLVLKNILEQLKEKEQPCELRFYFSGSDCRLRLCFEYEHLHNVRAWLRSVFERWTDVLGGVYDALLGEGYASYQSTIDYLPVVLDAYFKRDAIPKELNTSGSCHFEEQTHIVRTFVCAVPEQKTA